MVHIFLSTGQVGEEILYTMFNEKIWTLLINYI
jgi:hypothetical protein